MWTVIVTVIVGCGGVRRYHSGQGYHAPTQCYYQPYYKQLTCSCEGDLAAQDMEQFINIKLGYFIRELGQEVQKCVLYEIMTKNYTCAISFKSYN